MKWFSALLLALLLSGCAGLRLSMNQHALQDFQQAIATQHFKQAEQLAANLPASHKDHAAVQKALPSLRQAEQKFASDSLRNARKLAGSQQLQTAIDLLTEARQTLPNPPAELEKLQTQLQQQQQQQIHQHQADLLASEADWLLDQQSSLDYLIRQQENVSARDQAQHLKQRQPQLAQQLVELGQAFAKRDDWQNSYRCLSLAQRLGATHLPKDTLKQAQAQLQRAQQQRTQQRREAQQTEADERLARYQQSQLMADLLAARDYINANNQHDSLKTQADTLKQLSQRRFNHDMHLGDTLYASGHYQSAERIWRRLAPLYPHNNELAKKLERVQKVLHSLDTLKPH